MGLVAWPYLINLIVCTRIPKKKNYFTSCDPHHDIYTLCCWQIFWHSIWHIFWHSIWHSIFWHSNWHILWHSIWHIFWHIFWHLIWHSIWQIFWHSIWQTFWHFIWHTFWHSIWHIFLHEVRQGTLGVDTRGWGPAGNTGRGWSWLRSGREHWAGMVVFEVRQGTLGLDGRGWGPAENTVDRGSQLDEDNEDDEEDKEDEEEEDEAGGGRRKAEGGRQEAATDIKSNNPHLAGGEWTPRATAKKMELLDIWKSLGKNTSSISWKYLAWSFPVFWYTLYRVIKRSNWKPSINVVMGKSSKIIELKGGILHRFPQHQRERNRSPKNGCPSPSLTRSWLPGVDLPAEVIHGILYHLDMGNSDWKNGGFSPSTNGKFMGIDDLVFTMFLPSQGSNHETNLGHDECCSSFSSWRRNSFCFRDQAVFVPGLDLIL